MAYNFVRASSQRLRGSFSISATPTTIAFWANATVNTLALGAFSVSDSVGNEALRGFFAGNLAGDPFSANSLDNGVAGTATNAGTFSPNAWHHAAVIYTSITSRTSYLDGVAGTANTVSSDPTGLTTLLIGAIMVSSAPASHFDGNLSEFGVWNVALTAAEIVSLAKGFSAKKIRPQSLEFYAPIVRNIGDYIGGVSLSNENTATVTSHNRIYS